MLDWRTLTKCTRCPALGTHHVPPEGPMASELFILGQSPGVTEVEEDRPFCGPSGEALDFLLDELLLDRELVYVTNTLKCHPPENRPGTAEEINTCKQTWLSKELKIVDPSIVLTLGKDAFISMMGAKNKHLFKHGHVWRRKKRSLVCFYHPAYFLRRGDLEGFLQHADRIEAELEFWRERRDEENSLLGS